MVVSPSLVNVSPSVQIQTKLEGGVSHCKVKHIFLSKDILCQIFENHYTYFKTLQSLAEVHADAIFLSVSANVRCKLK